RGARRLLWPRASGMGQRASLRGGVSRQSGRPHSRGTGQPQPSASTQSQPSHALPMRAASNDAARWWGQAMLLLGGVLTVLQYATTRSSYIYAFTPSRYIVGVSLCTPLIAAPLCRNVQRLARWYRQPARRRPTHPPWRALLAGSMLVTLFAVN